MFARMDRPPDFCDFGGGYTTKKEATAGSLPFIIGLGGGRLFNENLLAHYDVDTFLNVDSYSFAGYDFSLTNELAVDSVYRHCTIVSIRSDDDLTLTAYDVERRSVGLDILDTGSPAGDLDTVLVTDTDTTGSGIDLSEAAEDYHTERGEDSVSCSGVEHTVICKTIYFLSLR